MAQSGQPLTADSMNALYRRLNELYYAGAVVDDLQDIEWARIPHFYNAFYVYQYATGYSAAVAIADRILATGDASDYLRFLTTGGRRLPHKGAAHSRRRSGEAEVVSNALKEFGNSVDELEKLLGQLK